MICGYSSYIQLAHAAGSVVCAQKAVGIIGFLVFSCVLPRPKPPKPLYCCRRLTRTDLRGERAHIESENRQRQSNQPVRVSLLRVCAVHTNNGRD